MNKRTFLTSALSLFGLAVTPKLLTATEVKPKLFDVSDKPHFTIHVTKNVIIPHDDNYFTNVYGEHCKLISKVIIPATKLEDVKIVRFESKLLLCSELNETHWIDFKASIVDYMKNNPGCGTTYNMIPGKIILA